MTARPSVSFVVIAYNEERNILCTLNSIIALEQLGTFELIVVNDGSQDGTAWTVRDMAVRNPCIRLIDLADNRGRGHARHLGIAAAQGELIATIDADIVLPRDWYARASAALGIHSAVGGTAVPDGDVTYLHRRFDLIPRPLNHTVAVTGSNALYRREVFDIIQFDSTLREGEDSALNHAMLAMDMSFSTVPGLLVQHVEAKGFLTSLRWLFDVGRGATRQLLTYRKVRGPDVATGTFVVTTAAGLVAGVRGHRFLGTAVPVCLLLGASTQHVRSRFETPRGHWPRLAAAAAADTALLTAYFTGRVAGLAIARQQEKPGGSSAGLRGELRPDIFEPAGSTGTGRTPNKAHASANGVFRL